MLAECVALTTSTHITNLNSDVNLEVSPAIAFQNLLVSLPGKHLFACLPEHVTCHGMRPRDDNARMLVELATTYNTAV